MCVCVCVDLRKQAQVARLWSAVDSNLVVLRDQLACLVPSPIPYSQIFSVPAPFLIPVFYRAYIAQCCTYTSHFLACIMQH